MVLENGRYRERAFSQVGGRCRVVSCPIGPQPRPVQRAPRPRPSVSAGRGFGVVNSDGGGSHVAVHTPEPLKTRGFAGNYNGKTAVLRLSDILEPLVFPGPDL